MWQFLKHPTTPTAPSTLSAPRIGCSRGAEDVLAKEDLLRGHRILVSGSSCAIRCLAHGSMHYGHQGGLLKLTLLVPCSSPRFSVPVLTYRVRCGPSALVTSSYITWILLLGGTTALPSRACVGRRLSENFINVGESGCWRFLSTLPLTVPTCRNILAAAMWPLVFLYT